MKTLFLFSFFVLHGVAAGFFDPPDGGCCAENSNLPIRHVTIRCVKLGIDGRSFDKVIGDGLIIYDPHIYIYRDPRTKPEEYLRNGSVSEIADFVDRILLGDSRNVIIDAGALSRFPNLTDLLIIGPNDGERGRLILSPGVFRQSPRLERMHISRLDFSDESIRELGDLKTQITILLINNVSPDALVYVALAQFTALQYVRVSNCSTRQPFPVNFVRNSAALEWFQIENCHVPKLLKYLFSSAPKLLILHVNKANLSEVEASAFDHNPKLLKVDLSDNDLPMLPDGLFNTLTNLSFVYLDRNPRLIGSIDKSNFTHASMFEYFHFSLS